MGPTMSKIFNRTFAGLFLFLLLITVVNGEAQDLFLEADQMLQLRLGAEASLGSGGCPWALRGSFGVSPLGITTLSANLLGVCRVRNPERGGFLSLEAGLPLVYGDFLENNLVDWDPIIDDPYFGFLAGGAVRGGWRFGWGSPALRLGVALWWEFQRDSGWKGPGVLPVVALVFS